MSGEPQPLNLAEGAVGNRGRVGLVAALVGVVIGGVVGLFAGRVVGTSVAVVVAGLLVATSWLAARRRVSLVGSDLVARTVVTSTVDLRRADRLDLIVTDLRGVRTISLVAGGPPRGRSITVALAAYSGIGGRELDILALRRLADALASSTNTTGLVLSELLIAQLRGEARGAGVGERALHRLAARIEGGGLSRRVPTDVLTTFVAALD